MRLRWLAALTAGTMILAGLPSPVKAAQVQLDVAATYPTMLAGEKQTNYLRIGLTGFELPSTANRPPVNVAIVLDKSGSMQGDKIDGARRAAVAAVNRLRDNDIVSIVVYDTGVSVLVPATKATDREQIIQAIKNVQSGGGTALFAGVSKGAAELRKFKQDDQVNRIILLSDGLANEGPSSTAELAELGESLLKEGISVSTLGLGLDYNEDLMTSLAAASSGNHVFIEGSEDLVAVFNNEFDDILSVVATDFSIRVQLDPSARPVRVLGTPADIDGQSVSIPLNQLYSGQQRYFVLEMEVSPGEAESTRPLANVTVGYKNLQTKTEDTLANSLQLRFTNQAEQVQEDIHSEALAYCTLQITTDRNRQATALRDAGRVEEARALLAQNADDLRECKLLCPDKLSEKTVMDLDFGIEGNRLQSESIIDATQWSSNRKRMRQYQNVIEQQQRYTGKGKIDPSKR